MFVTSLRRALLPGLLGVVLLVAAALPPAPAQAQIQPGLWPGAVPVTSSEGGPAEPSLAYDRDGFLHVVYYAGEKDAWRVYYTNNRAGVWSAPRILEQRGAGQRYPDIAVGPDNRIHVVYTREGQGNIIYVESPDAGATWLPSVTVVDSPRSTITPAIAVDNNNTVHLVWCDRRWGDFGATYMRRVGGIWTTSRQIGLNAFERQTDIAVTGSGASVRVHIVFEARVKDTNLLEDFDVYYVRGDGDTFEQPRNISGDNNRWSLAPTIASNGLNELYVVWDVQDRYHDVAFTRSTTNGDSWVPFTNITRRSNGSFWPNVIYGASGLVHISWFESETDETDRDLLYLNYDPVRGSYGSYTELVNTRATASAAPGLAASPVNDQLAVANQSVYPRRVYVSARGGSVIVRGSARLNGDAGTSTTRQLTAELINVVGSPDQMRYAWNRDPNDTDSWQAYAPSFSVTAPDNGACQQELRVQLLAGTRASPVFGDSILVDSSVQARVEIANPGIGDAGYSSSGFVDIDVQGQGECSGLKRLVTDEGSYAIENDRIKVRPGLPDSRSEGSRVATAKVDDGAGNSLTISRTIIIDRQAPDLASGADLDISVPQGGLTSPLVNLRLSNIKVTDDYPGGFWGVEVTNVDRAAAQAGTPVWSAMPVQAGTTLVVPNWNVLSGLGRSLSDGKPGGGSVEIRVRFLDGAGNPTSEVLTRTVQLADDLQPLYRFMPLAGR